MTFIDNPCIWTSDSVWIYADFSPNDRGYLGGVLRLAGGSFHDRKIVTPETMVQGFAVST